MGKTYENWLVVSDIDGTLNSKARTLPKRNLDAITEFVNAGGNFTLASGRLVTSLGKAYGTVPCNAPAVILNGAGIYDYNKNKLLVKNEINEDGRALVKSLMKKYPLAEVGIFFEDFVYIVRAGILSLGQIAFDKSNYKICSLDEVPKNGWCKVIFWSNPVVVKAMEKYVDANNSFGMTFMETSIWSYEMLAGGIHKGTGVMQLAEKLGIDKSHVAAIGDYYNDYDMLKSVGLPACAGQAPKDIHKICKLVACHCNQGCVADLIEYIMALEESEECNV